MDDKLIAGLVGGASALVVALVNNRLGRKNQEALAVMKRDFDLEAEQLRKALERQGEQLKSEFSRKLETLRGTIADRNNAASARRDYEYEALKRLYTDVEPLLFQLYEALDEAQHRVASLCRSSRSGNLGAGRGNWLRGDGYYLRSTAYKLALPVAYLRLIQPKITFVDLSLDASIYMRYLLLKLYCRSFTDDFQIAALEPKLAYDPNNDDWQGRRDADPAVYQRQGLLVGTVENIAAALVINERAKLFSEFEEGLDSEEGEGGMSELVGMLQGFSAKGRPVLARTLVTQGYLAKLVRLSFEAGTKPADLPERLEQVLRCPDLKRQFAWVEGEEPGSAVREYLTSRIQLVSEMMGKRG